ncbi:hypothetical protein (secreted) [Limnospira indica PCC 8005]|uniref:Uncharacterized protein n=1 Tax=Limnospira indica PCC 8005 TaxID=376219 RepID=A0A9P1NXA3_9CYAN|nr:hypothetical protein (secreted) [Limnospira indica PCC 8005]
MARTPVLSRFLCLVFAILVNIFVLWTAAGFFAMLGACAGLFLYLVFEAAGASDAALGLTIITICYGIGGLVGFILWFPEFYKNLSCAFLEFLESE